MPEITTIRRLAACAVPFVAIALETLRPSASPAAPLELGIWDARFSSSDESTRSAWTNRARKARAGMVRVLLQWRSVASDHPSLPRDPGDPAYNFSSIDNAVRGAEQLAEASRRLRLGVGRESQWPACR